MGNCRNVCRLCDRFVASESITFTPGTGGAPGTLVIDLPAGSYNDGEKYCIILTDVIPPTTAIGANVVFTIGGGDVQYPLVNRCCRPIMACGIRTRYKYSVCVETTATGAVFKMLGTPFCQPNNNLRSVNGTAPAVTPTPGA